MSCIAEKCAKTFGADPVFENVSLRIDQGEIVCLMGPSGAGKTTLLRCLCGLELPEKGTISLSGTVLCQDGHWCDPVQYRQKIGLVFQNWNLFPHWTVLRNLTEAPVRLKGMSREEAEKKARRLLEQLKIEQKAQAYPNSLSGGQRLPEPACWHRKSCALMNRPAPWMNNPRWMSPRSFRIWRHKDWASWSSRMTNNLPGGREHGSFG